MLEHRGPLNAGNMALSSFGPARGPNAGNSTLSSLDTAPPRRLSKARSCRPKIVGGVSVPLGSRPAQGGFWARFCRLYLREVKQTDTSQLTKSSKQRLPQGKRISIFDSSVPQRVRNRIDGKGKRWVPRTSRRGAEACVKEVNPQPDSRNRIW